MTLLSVGELHRNRGVSAGSKPHRRDPQLAGPPWRAGLAGARRFARGDLLAVPVRVYSAVRGVLRGVVLATLAPAPVGGRHFLLLDRIHAGEPSDGLVQIDGLRTLARASEQTLEVALQLAQCLLQTLLKRYHKK